MKTILPLNIQSRALAFFQASPAYDIVLVTSVDSEERANIIPLHLWMLISIRPPLACIGIHPARYSHSLVSKSGEFVVNMPSINLKEEVHFCGTHSGRDFDKFIETGLTPMPANKVRSPLIEECFGHLECRVVQSHRLGDKTLFVGEVLAASVNKDVLTQDKLDPLKAKPIIEKNRVYYTVTDSYT